MDIPSYLMGRNAGGKSASTQVVTELPEVGQPNVIYLVPKQTAGDNDVFDEYIYVNDDWELIGSTAIDISGKQDVMQFSTMPTADSTTVGKIIQYVGATNANYTNGYFYVCIGTTENDVTTYSWSNVEVQEKSKSYPVYVAKLSVGVGGTIEGGNTLTDNDMNIISNIITDAFQKGYEHIILQLEGNSNSNKSSVLLTYCNENIQNKPISITFGGMDKGNSRLLDNSLPFIYSYQLVINIQWSNDVASKRGDSKYYAVSKAVLLTSNTAAYTPTSNYQPATKKYVDDSIAAAITTTLGGSY